MCEYCEGKRELLFFEDQEYIVEIRNGNRLTLADYDDDYCSSEIKFCPMCGSKLND